MPHLACRTSGSAPSRTGHSSVIAIRTDCISQLPVPLTELRSSIPTSRDWLSTRPRCGRVSEPARTSRHGASWSWTRGRRRGRRAARQRHRLRHPPDAPADWHRGVLPERVVAAQEPGVGGEGPALAPVRAYLLGRAGGNCQPQMTVMRFHDCHRRDLVVYNSFNSYRRRNTS